MMNSKKKISVIILSLFSVLHFDLCAQVCFNGVSTDPVNPFNFDANYSFSNNLWLNSFDIGLNNGASFSDIFLNPAAGWSIPYFTSTAQFQMLNPYTSGGAPGASHLSQPTPFTSRDFHWEDGWELLYLGIGYYPNGHPFEQAPSNAPIFTPAVAYDFQIPYMIYYNRYSGLIRLFAGLFVPYQGAQSLTVDLSMNSDPLSTNYTGLLRHLSKYDTPLDQPTPYREQRGVNNTGYQGQVSSNSRVWYVYDFQVGFDPCTCNDFSELNFNFSAVQWSTVSLYGRMISLDEPLVDSNGNVTYNEDFLTATSIQSQDPNGYIMRSSLDGLVEDYRESLRIYNEQLDDRQFLRNGWFRNVLEDFQGSIVDDAVDLVPGGDIAEWIVDKNLNLGTDAEDVEKLVKSGSKSLIGSGYNFLSNQIFGDHVNPVRPSRPVATFSEMRFSGDITTSSSSLLAGFWTPGTDYTGEDFTPHNYPSYNEVLGMYSTLKTPDIESYETIESSTTIDNTVEDVSDNITLGFPCFVNITGTTTETTITKTKSINQEIFFKLGALPEYALNEVLDFDWDETKVYVSFSMVLENGNPLPSNQMNHNFLSLLDPLLVEEDEDTNLWLKHDVPQDQGFFTKEIKRQITLNSGWYDIENAANLLLGASLNNSISFREEYEEFEALCGDDSSDETVPQILDEVLHFEPVRIEMKIMADMYFDQLSFSGETINTTQVFSYLILDEENNIDLIADNNNYVASSNENDFLLMFPGTLTIQSSVISGTSPEAYPSDESFVIKVRAEDIIIDQSVEGFMAAPGIGPLVKMELMNLYI